ncbi:hypothetical protein SAMN05192566_2083 [Methylophilus rhizosphaerae]|uniref:Uncharacterized protein n=1 Tax=Methylophilus rhizosphaerae TaxID=492660 RepID=A0A1G9DZU2_9PROT|nr:hypothetical protein [Methylophilus rhizosphaerae]SDK69376.1 hypothetical protein SAMN05192566_2083 [Methylophilus rhizosphaerae]
MKIRINPVAAFDTLFIANQLQKKNGSFSIPELHIFGYLACLLWLYREQPIADWEYNFVGTELGAPFSQDMDTAANDFLEVSLFYRSHERLQITDLGIQKLINYEKFTLNKKRTEYLYAACSSTLALSVGMVCTALSNEPELKRSNATPASRLLLEELARSQLYDQFSILHTAFYGRSDDLRLPAVTWLSALYSSSMSELA